MPPTQPKVVVPTAPENSTSPNVDSETSPESKTETKPKPGGYYLDDGPGDNAPANIDDIPNPVLKSEQPYERANKPYSALGQQFTPMTKYVPYKMQGIASWYGKRFHGKKTSTGEIYDMYAMTAAHTILPIPSYAKVTNPVNGRSVIVRINDRGPFKRDRLIDLSYAAAFQLRLIKQGSGLVEVETIDTSPEALKKISNNNSPTSIPENTTSKPDVVALDDSASSPSTASTNKLSTQYYVQVGAFKNESNGNFLIKKIQGLNLVENVDVANVYNNGLYRVKLGPYSSRNEADIAAANIRSQLNTAAHVTN
jgi:rare lipoprotein A